MTTPPPLPGRPQGPVPWWRRIGAQAGTALALTGTFLAVKVGPPVFGYVFGRSAISAIWGVKNRADPKYQAVTQGFRDAGLDADSTLKALGKRVDSTWFFNESALRSNTHLAGAELRELLAFRERVLGGLPTATCGGWVEGRPEAARAVQVALRARPDSELTRLTYLSVLAVARGLRDTTAIAPVSLDAYIAADSASRSSELSCAMGRAMYAAEHRAPFPSADADALMAMVIGR